MKKITIISMIAGIILLAGCSKKEAGPDYQQIRQDSEKSWGEVK